MTGTAGAIGTCTGQTPNGFSVASTPFTTAAGTCALSVQTLTNGVRALQAVLGGTMTSPQNLDVQVVLSTPGNFVTGDVIRGLFWVNLGATNTNIAALNPFIAVTTNAVISYHMAFDTPPEGIPAAGFPTTGGITYPMGGKNWVPMLSDEYTIPAGPVTQIYIDLRLGSKAAGAIASTMQTCCWEVRKVVP
jgi:hypothetical protein